MTHRTQLSQQDEEVTLVDLVTTATCPTCHTPAGSRCITRAGKPAAEPHSGRYYAVEQAAGITRHRAELRRSAGGGSYGIDRQAEAALLTVYAARLRPYTQQDDEAAAPAPTVEPKQNATPAQRQLDHALTALARTTPGRRRYIREAAAEYLAQVDYRILPVGYDQPIYGDWINRADAFKMRGGATVAAMLGLAVRPTDEHFPTTARAIITAVDTPVDTLVEAARTSGAPAAVALAHILGGAR